MHRIDGAGATSDNRFTDGDPASATPATIVTDEWLNAVQEELVAVIQSAGISLDKTKSNQLLEAINSKIPSAPPSATATVKGIVELATSAETVAGSDSVRAVTPSGLNAALVALLPKRSFVPGGDFIRIPDLPGGLIIQFGTGVVTTNTTGGAATISLPTAFPNAHIGGVCNKAGNAAINDVLVPYYSNTSLSTATLVLDAATGSGTPAGAQNVFYICWGY